LCQAEQSLVFNDGWAPRHNDEASFWSLRDGCHLRTVQGTAFGFAARAPRMLVRAGRQSPVWVCEIGGQPLVELERSEDPKFSPSSLSPDGTTAVGGGFDNRVWWETTKGAIVAVEAGARGFTSYSEDGRYVAAAPWMDPLEIIDCHTRAVRIVREARLTGSFLLSGVSFSDALSDRLIYWGGRKALVLGLSDYKLKLKLVTTRRFTGALVTDANSILSAHGDRLLFWDGRGQRRWELTMPAEYLLQISGTRHVVTGGANSGAMVWDLDALTAAGGR
jgi:hypothetical protein